MKGNTKCQDRLRQRVRGQPHAWRRTAARAAAVLGRRVSSRADCGSVRPVTRGTEPLRNSEFSDAQQELDRPYQQQEPRYTANGPHESKELIMTATTSTERTPSPRSTGPYVTPSGRRLPVRNLTPSDTPGMLEFWDYLARRADAPRLLGLERADVGGVLADPSTSMLAVMAGPRQLIRAVALCRPQTAVAADVRFSVDDSVVADGVFPELIYRVADDARERGIRELRLVAPVASDALAALTACGFPVSQSQDDGAIHVDISAAL